MEKGIESQIMDHDLNEKLLKETEKNVDRVALNENLKDKLWIENKKMWAVAGPAIFTRVSNFGINIISQAFIGHVGSTELAAYALTFTVLVTFGDGILLGMASALETLCGQAYGAKQYKMMGIYLQRSWLVLLICALFITPIFFFAAPILKFLGQDAFIADMAGTISHWFIPVIFSFIISYTCQMFLQAQSRNKIIAYVAAFSLPFHIFLSWLLTIKFNLGVPGIMISMILTVWIPNIGQLAYVFGSCRETWHGFSLLAFKDLWHVIKLSLSSGAMLCVEVWYYTVIILLTGNMENAEVAIDALSICLNIIGWEMMISLGFLAAASVRVSNELGRGSSKDAKFSILNTLMTSFAIGFVLFIFFLLFQGRVAYIFTDSAEVAAVVADLSPLVAFSILLSSIQPVLLGVAVGAGRQSTVAYVSITSNYIVGVPVGALLGYVTNLQVKGVWIGMLIGTLVQTIILIIITYKTDWDNQVIVAQKRLNKWIVEPDQPYPNQLDV